MAVLKTLPMPPKPPPGTLAITDKAWVDYFSDLYQWQLKLRAALISG